MSVIIGAFPPSFLGDLCVLCGENAGASGLQLPISGSFGDFGNLLGTLPLPRPSQIGVDFRGSHPKASQIGVDFSDQASIGVGFRRSPSGVRLKAKFSKIILPPPGQRVPENTLQLKTNYIAFCSLLSRKINQRIGFEFRRDTHHVAEAGASFI
jgi:hypothetical protein